MTSINSLVRSFCAHQAADPLSECEETDGTKVHRFYDAFWTLLLGLTGLFRHARRTTWHIISSLRSMKYGKGDDGQIRKQVLPQLCAVVALFDEDENDLMESYSTLIDEGVDKELEHVRDSLTFEDFPELSEALTCLVERFRACTSCQVAEKEDVVRRRREMGLRSCRLDAATQEAVLIFLLSLRGSRASFRRRKTTFQPFCSLQDAYDYADKEDSVSSASELNPSLRRNGRTLSLSEPVYDTYLQSDIFDEAPEPDALVECCSRTITVLSSKDVGSTAKIMQEEQETVACSNDMESRPQWDPVVDDASEMESSTWIPRILARNAFSDLYREKKTLVPSRLQVSMSNLAMDCRPGHSTALFPEKHRSIETSHCMPVDAVKERDNPVFNPSRKLISSGNQSRILEEDLANGLREERFTHDLVGHETDPMTDLGRHALWTEQEIQLAHDAFLALKGVHVTLLRLQGTLDAAPLLSYGAQMSLLSMVCTVGLLRQHVEQFVRNFSISKHNLPDHLNTSIGTKGQYSEDAAATHGRSQDPILLAFSGAVGQVLHSLTSELDLMDIFLCQGRERSYNQDHESSCIDHPTITGQYHLSWRERRLHQLSLLRVCTETRTFQQKVRYLASLCWCTTSERCSYSDIETSEELEMRWKAASVPLTGLPLLEYLYRETRAAEGPMEGLAKHLFSKALEPYLDCLYAWVFTSLPINESSGSSLLQYASSKSPFDLPTSAPARWHPPTSMTLSSDHTLSRTFSNIEGRYNAECEEEYSMKSFPSFLEHIGDQLSTSGIQLRFLSSIAEAQPFANKIIKFHQDVLKSLEQRPIMDGEDASLPSSILAHLIEPSSISDRGQQCLDNNVSWGANAAQVASVQEEARSAIQLTIKDASSSLMAMVDEWLDGLPSKLDKEKNQAPTERCSLPGQVESTHSSREAWANGRRCLQEEYGPHYPENGRLESMMGCTISEYVQTHVDAVGRACMGLCCGPFQLDQQFQFLRRAFFFEDSGDWCHAFLIALDERVAKLQPFAPHHLRMALEDAIGASTLRENPWTKYLEIHVMPAGDALQEAMRALQYDTKDARSLGKMPQKYCETPVVLVPHILESLDRVLLRFDVSWPMTAVLPEDCLVGYAAVWNAMMHTRWVSFNLTKLRRRVGSRHVSGLFFLPDRRGPSDSRLGQNLLRQTHHGRLTRLSLFAHSAGLYVQALQEFQFLCTRRCHRNHGSEARTAYAECQHVQKVVDAHRLNVRETAEGCLEVFGHTALKNAIWSASQRVLDVLAKARITTEKYSTSEDEECHDSWLDVLLDDALWTALAETMQNCFDAIQSVRAAVEDVDVSVAEQSALTPLISWVQMTSSAWTH